MIRSWKSALFATAVATASLTAAVTNAIAETDVAESTVPSSCVVDAEKAGRALIFDVEWAVERPHVKPQIRWAALRKAHAALVAFDRDQQVEACWLAHPEHRKRIDELSERFVQPALALAQSHLDEICTDEAMAIVIRKQGDVEAALADNRLSDAAQAADELEYGITHGETVTHCPPMDERIHELLTDYIPGVRNAIALPKVTSDMESALAAVEATWRPTRAALATSGKTIAQAPTYLTTEDGQQTFRDHVAACRHFAGSLRSLGKGGNYPLRPRRAGRRHRTRLADAEKLCKQIGDHLDELFVQVTDHNTAYTAEQKRKWEWVHIKGWGMWRIYNRHGRPTSTSNVGDDEIAWTYESTPKAGVCTVYRFTARGAQQSRRRMRCPAVANRGK